MSQKEKQQNDNLIMKIKSIFTIRILFAHLNRKTKLKIIKLNKSLQADLNLSINDYKNFSEKYSKIEIIIFPSKERKARSQIINYDEKNKNFYHIYFNDNLNEEVKNNYIEKNEEISKIIIIIDSEINTLKELFEGCSEIESIFFIKFLRNNITDMSAMFRGCSKLKIVKFLQVNTSNVTNMNYMFNKCLLIKELDLSKFDTHKVTNMNSMFFDCKSLEKLF